jgi:hypothetical protein
MEYETQAASLVFDSAKPSWVWMQINASNRVGVVGRGGHAAVGIEDLLIIFGGCSKSTLCFSDTIVLDTSEMRWYI